MLRIVGNILFAIIAIGTIVTSFTGPEWLTATFLMSGGIYVVINAITFYVGEYRDKKASQAAKKQTEDKVS